MLMYSLSDDEYGVCGDVAEAVKSCVLSEILPQVAPPLRAGEEGGFGREDMFNAWLTARHLRREIASLFGPLYSCIGCFIR